MWLNKLLLILVISIVLLGACAEPAPSTALSETSATTPTPLTTTLETPVTTLTITAEVTPDTDATTEATIPIIDAHSQICREDLEEVVKLMDKAGVSCVILAASMTSTEEVITPEELASFSFKYPGRIIPAVRTKVRTEEEFNDLLETQINLPQYGAMAEILIYHDSELGKPQKVPQVIAHIGDSNIQLALQYSLERDWPFIMHIEFVAAGDMRNQFMTELKALLAQYPEHPFVLIHCQLDCAGHRQLIESYNNIYFITAGTTGNIQDVISNSPWTNMFDGDHLAADWKQLMIDHPDRFIFGVDTVWPGQWGQYYLHEIDTWREAMIELPADVANAFAHGNAEHLWHLAPLK